MEENNEYTGELGTSPSEMLSNMKATLVMLEITSVMSDDSLDEKQKMMGALKVIRNYGDQRVMESMTQ